MTRIRFLAAIIGLMSVVTVSLAISPASAAPVSTGTMATSQQSAETAPLVTPVQYYYGRRVYRRPVYYRRPIYRRPVYVRRVYGRRYYRRY